MPNCKVFSRKSGDFLPVHLSYAACIDYGEGVWCKLDRQTEHSVWERVGARPCLTAAQALLPERLTALMQREITGAAACRQLAARLSGTDGASLRRLQAQAQARVRQLNALRFLYTGLRAEIKPANIAFHSAVCDALREEGLLLAALQEQYEKTAEEFPTQAEQLTALCTQVRQNLRSLTDVLQRHL